MMNEENYRYILYPAIAILVCLSFYLWGRASGSKTGEAVHDNGNGIESARREVQDSRKLNDECADRIERSQEAANSIESAVDRSQNDLRDGIRAVREGRAILEKIRKRNEKG